MDHVAELLRSHRTALHSSWITSSITNYGPIIRWRASTSMSTTVAPMASASAYRRPIRRTACAESDLQQPGRNRSRVYAWPNQVRNTYRGPGFFDSDFTINKNFKLTERMAFGFGANFYNIFNHPNFTNPDSNLGDYPRSERSQRRRRRRPVRTVVRHRPAFGTHHPVPGQAGVLEVRNKLALPREAPSGASFFLLGAAPSIPIFWFLSRSKKVVRLSQIFTKICIFISTNL